MTFAGLYLQQNRFFAFRNCLSCLTPVRFFFIHLLSWVITPCCVSNHQILHLGRKPSYTVTQQWQFQTHCSDENGCATYRNLVGRLLFFPF